MKRSRKEKNVFSIINTLVYFFSIGKRMGSVLSLLPSPLAKIHAIFNQRSVIHTTTLTPLPRQHSHRGSYSIATMDGSCVDVFMLSTECVICSSKIDFFDLIASVNDRCDLICYSCLIEAKKTFICDRLMLLKEIIIITELREHIISSLQCVMPKEKFTLSSGTVFTGYRNNTRISYTTQLELIYNDLSRLQMKLPYATSETSAHVSFRWRHCSNECDVIRLLLRLENGDWIVNKYSERFGELVDMMTSDDILFTNVNDALMHVKDIINV
jgi:hypothetical protein